MDRQERRVKLSNFLIILSGRETKTAEISITPILRLGVFYNRHHKLHRMVSTRNIVNVCMDNVCMVQQATIYLLHGTHSMTRTNHNGGDENH